jgi:hypothetical protein
MDLLVAKDAVQLHEALQTGAKQSRTVARDFFAIPQLDLGHCVGHLQNVKSYLVLLPVCVPVLAVELVFGDGFEHARENLLLDLASLDEKVGVLGTDQVDNVQVFFRFSDILVDRFAVLRHNQNERAAYAVAGRLTS